MQFFLDTADIEAIKKYAAWGIVDGVTTNPSLIAKEGVKLEDRIKEITEIVDGPISAEVVATDAEGMQLLVEDPDIKIDGFINPGHVSSIIGSNAYKNVNASQVIAGFKPLDVLEAISMLLNQIINNEKKVDNQYIRLVKPEGNVQAQQIIHKYFKKADVSWRGFGILPNTGLEIADEYEHLNAKIKYKEMIDKACKDYNPKENTACKCGSIIKGLCSPKDCPLFNNLCTPEKPIGPCMVGREGSCNVAYRFS